MAPGLSLLVPYRRRGRRADPSTVPAAPAAPATPNTPSPADAGTALYTRLSWLADRQATADVCLSPSTAVSYAAAVLGDGPLGYWRLGDVGASAVDVSNTPHPGTYTGAVTRQQVGALLDGDLAAEFDGATGQILNTASLAAITGACTIEAWVYADTLSAVNRRMVFAGKTTSYLSVNLTTGRIFFSLDIGGVQQFVSGATNIAVGGWHHLVGTRDTDKLRVYLDGVLDGTSTSFVGATSWGTGTFRIGAYDGTVPDNFWDGRIDEVALYGVCLTPTQIATHYAQRLAGPPVRVHHVGFSYVPTVLPSTTYYWQIVAYNAGGSTAGPIWSFTTPAATQWIFLLAGVDVTSRVRLEGSSIHEALHAAPNTAELVIDTTAPTTAAAIQIGLGRLDDDALLFAGTIQTVGDRYVDHPDSLLWPVSLVDYTFAINKRRPFGTYVDVSATTIALEWIARYAPGFSGSGVAPNLPTVSITVDGSDDFMTCLGRLATAIGGQSDVDYRKIVSLCVTDTGDPPDPLTALNPPLNDPPMTFATDLSQLRTRVYGKGHGETVPLDVAAGETIVPIGDAVMFSETGGQAIAATTSGAAQSEILTYTGVQLGDAGTLVGPGVAPAVAPNLSPIVGAGLSVGTYQYATVFGTAAGKSLPGPTRAITVGLMAAPTGAPYPVTASGSGLSVGTYQYAYTDVTAAGETLPGPGFTVDVIAPSAPAAPAIDNTVIGNAWNGFAAGDTVDEKLTYSWAAASSDDTKDAIGPAATFVAVASGVPDYANDPLVSIVHAVDPAIRWVKLWQQVNGGGYLFVKVWTNVPGTTTIFLQNVYPTATTIPAAGVWKQVQVSSLAPGPIGTTARNLYRTVAGGAQLKRVVQLADNTTQEYLDAIADGSLGANAPTVATAIAQQVGISAVALGPTGTTYREVHRTAVGGTQLKLQQTIANNTATAGVTDATADAALGANVPTTDTSGLTQPTGQVNAGSTTLLTAGVPFADAGWVRLGDTWVRYTGISGNTLTGIPPSGAGALLTTVPYGTLVISGSALTGVNRNNGLTHALAKGSAIHIWVERNDLDAQAALGLLELDADGHPTDGIHDYTISDERRGEASLTAACDADLATFSRPIVSVTYHTRHPNHRPGRIVSIDLAGTGFGLSGDFVIQSTTITSDGPLLAPRYAVQASSVSFTLMDLLRKVVIPT